MRFRGLFGFNDFGRNLRRGKAQLLKSMLDWPPEAPNPKNQPPVKPGNQIIEENGAGEGIRTLDFLVGNEMLYH